MNKHARFCMHWASWLHAETWHFKTLLAVSIHAVDNLPSDANTIIHALVYKFPQKPQQKQIEQWLKSNPDIRAWFTWGHIQPRIRVVNLASDTNAVLLPMQYPQLYTLGDLAKWLKVTPGQLDWLADFRRSDKQEPTHFRHYHYNVSTKRNGSARLIESPKKLLKQAQRKINLEILSLLEIHDASHGFRKNRDCRTHATLHTAKQFVFLFDLAHCFYSCRFQDVRSLFQKLGFPESVSQYLAWLCTHRCYNEHPALSALDDHQQELLSQRHLPQGAPTSPALSNALLMRLDKRVDGLARSLDLTYSRYADDLALSGNTVRDWRFLEPLLGTICQEEGFALNHRKSRLYRASQRQKITGIVVNKRVNIDRRDYDRLKAILTNSIRHGLDSQNRMNHANFRSHLKGLIAHVKSLNASKGNALERLFDQIP